MVGLCSVSDTPKMLTRLSALLCLKPFSGYRSVLVRRYLDINEAYWFSVGQQRIAPTPSVIPSVQKWHSHAIKESEKGILGIEQG